MKKIKILSSSNPFGVIKRIIIKFVWYFLPLKYAYQFIIILRKNEKQIT